MWHGVFLRVLKTSIYNFYYGGKEMKKLICTVLAIVVILLVSCSPSSQNSSASAGGTSSVQAPTHLRWGMANPAGAPLDLGAKRFSQLFQEATGGAFIIDTYPQAQLGNERDLIEGVSLGSVDFCHVSGALTNFSSAYLTFDLPYIVKNTPEGLTKAYAVLDGPIGREVLDSLLAKDIKGLAFWYAGFRNMLNSRKNVRTPDDIKNLKIRTMENELHLAFYNSVGAVPTAIASSEAFTALQQGVIDGMDNNINSFYTQKAYEAAKYMSLTNHIYTPASILMGLKLYNSFTPEQQQAVERIAAEVRDWERQIAIEDDISSIKALRENGVTVIDDIDYDAWQKACSSVYDQYRGRINQKYLDAFLK
jgi:tripartite ATP-independent transporter DctP family solute receptor